MLEVTKEELFTALELAIGIRIKGMDILHDYHYGVGNAKFLKTVNRLTMLPLTSFIFFYDYKTYLDKYQSELSVKGVDAKTATIYANFFAAQHSLLKNIFSHAGGCGGRAFGLMSKLGKGHNFVSASIFGIADGFHGSIAAERYYDAHEMKINDYLSTSLGSYLTGQNIQSYDQLVAHLKDPAHKNTHDVITKLTHTIQTELQKFENSFVPTLEDLHIREADQSLNEAQPHINGKDASFKLNESKKAIVCSFLNKQFIDCSSLSDKQLVEISDIYDQLEVRTAELRQAKQREQAFAAIDGLQKLFGAASQLGNEQLARFGAVGENAMSLLASAVVIGDILTSGAFNAVSLANPIAMSITAIAGIVSAVSRNKKSDPAMTYVMQRLDYIAHKIERLEQLMIAGFEYTQMFIQSGFEKQHAELVNMIVEARGHFRKQVLQQQEFNAKQQENFQQLSNIIMRLAQSVDSVSALILLETKLNIKTELEAIGEFAENSNDAEFDEWLSQHLSRTRALITRASESIYGGGQITTDDSLQILNQFDKLNELTPMRANAIAFENLVFIRKYLHLTANNSLGTVSQPPLISYNLLKLLVVAYSKLSHRVLINHPDCTFNPGLFTHLHLLKKKLEMIITAVEWITDSKQIDILKELQAHDYTNLESALGMEIYKSEENIVKTARNLDADEITMIHQKFQKDFISVLYKMAIMMPVAWRRPLFDSFYINVIGPSIHVLYRINGYGYLINNRDVSPVHPLNRSNAGDVVTCFAYPQKEFMSPDKLIFCDLRLIGRVLVPMWHNLLANGYAITVLDGDSTAAEEIFKRMGHVRYFFRNEAEDAKIPNNRKLPRLVFTEKDYNVLYFSSTNALEKLTKKAVEQRTANNASPLMRNLIGTHGNPEQRRIELDKIGTEAIASYYKSNGIPLEKIDEAVTYDKTSVLDAIRLHNGTLLNILSAQSDFQHFLKNQRSVWSQQLQSFQLLVESDRSFKKIDAYALPNIKIIFHDTAEDEEPMLGLSWPSWLISHEHLKSALIAENYGLGLIRARYKLIDSQLTINVSFSLQNTDSVIEYSLCEFQFHLANAIQIETATNFDEFIGVNSEATLRSRYSPEEQLYLVWYGGYYAKLGNTQTILYSLTPPDVFEGYNNYPASGKPGYTLFHHMQYPLYMSYMGLCNETSIPSKMQVIIPKGMENFELLIKSLIQVKRQSMATRLLNELHSPESPLGKTFLSIQARRSILKAIWALFPTKKQPAIDWALCSNQWWQSRLVYSNTSVLSSFSLANEFEFCRNHDSNIGRLLADVNISSFADEADIHDIHRSLNLLGEMLQSHPQNLCGSKQNEFSDLKLEISNLKAAIGDLKDNNAAFVREIRTLLSNQQTHQKQEKFNDDIICEGASCEKKNELSKESQHYQAKTDFVFANGIASTHLDDSYPHIVFDRHRRISAARQSTAYLICKQIVQLYSELPTQLFSQSRLIDGVSPSAQQSSLHENYLPDTNILPGFDAQFALFMVMYNWLKNMLCYFTDLYQYDNKWLHTRTDSIIAPVLSATKREVKREQTNTSSTIYSQSVLISNAGLFSSKNARNNTEQSIHGSFTAFRNDKLSYC